MRHIAIAFIAFLNISLAGDAGTRPHIVVFLADDLSWSDCSPNSPDSGIPTPNLELVAREGMRFSHAFVASPSCAPSRAALLTGLAPARNGAMFNHSVPDKNLKAWPAWFREAGYETVAIGKVAHYRTAKRYGFDHTSHDGGRDHTCVQAAVDWLRGREPGKPLCLMVGTHWPHTPWPEETGNAVAKVALPPNQIDTPETRRARARYAEAVRNADRDLGLFYDTVRRVLGRNTLFLFSSDNGSAFPFGKWNLYDDGIRTPLFVVWPGQVPAGSVSDAMVSWLDILPTCIEAAGVKPPPVGVEPGEIDGKSFLPVLSGRERSHRDLIFTTHSGDGIMNQYPIRSVRSREWHYIRNLRPETSHHTHIDKAIGGVHDEGFWKSWLAKAGNDSAAAAVIARYHHRPPEELYHVTADPWETTNLAGIPEHAGTLAELRSKLDARMRAEHDEGLPTEESHKPKSGKKTKR